MAYTKQDLSIMQAWPLERKIQVTQAKIIEWYYHYNGNVEISFSGGKDSCVLLDLARRAFPDIKAAFVNTGLEYPEIRDFVKSVPNVTWLTPEIPFNKVIEQHGYPVVSKEVARRIYYARRGSEWAVRHLQGFNKDGSYSKFAQRYIKWAHLVDAPFLISENCCKVMKLRPLHKHRRESGLMPIIGTMACESARRQSAYLTNGCNAFNKKEPSSQPLSFWTEQNILTYLTMTKIPYAGIYGDIVTEKGKLTTTGVQRSGCMFCMFGCHLEKKPNRFQRMELTHPKQHDYCINKLGCGKVLDYLAIEGLFYQFVRKLCELGEVKYEDVFVDGTKIEAAANRYTFVWKKAVEKNEAKMLLKVKALAEEIIKVYHVEFAVSKETVNEDMAKMAAFLEKKKADENINFVQGSGKRKSNLQKLLEALYAYQERQQGYDESKKILGERNSYSKTDKDATFMRMKDDHMKNGQLKPAYNVQLAVEAEYVIGVGIFPNPTDTTTLKPMLERMYQFNPQMIINRLTADSGYESEENYQYLESKGIDCYIKPQTYEQQKKRSFKKDISKRENMTYNAKTDEYTCHNQKQLKPIFTFNKKSAIGYVSEITVYECESCEGCPYKDKCTKAKGNRRMQVSKTFIEKRQKSYENITTEKGTLLRMNRSIQSEGAFGVLKEDRQFDRFLTRGKPNITTELLLLCFGYNVNKLHSKIQNERCGKPLHELKTA